MTFSRSNLPGSESVLTEESVARVIDWWQQESRRNATYLQWRLLMKPVPFSHYISLSEIKECYMSSFENPKFLKVTLFRELVAGGYIRPCSVDENKSGQKVWKTWVGPKEFYTTAYDTASCPGIEPLISLPSYNTLVAKHGTIDRSPFYQETFVWRRNKGATFRFRVITNPTEGSCQLPYYYPGAIPPGTDFEVVGRIFRQTGSGTWFTTNVNVPSAVYPLDNTFPWIKAPELDKCSMTIKFPLLHNPCAEVFIPEAHVVQPLPVKKVTLQDVVDCVNTIKGILNQYNFRVAPKSGPAHLQSTFPIEAHLVDRGMSMKVEILAVHDSYLLPKLVVMFSDPGKTNQGNEWTHTQIHNRATSWENIRSCSSMLKGLVDDYNEKRKTAG